MKTDLKEYKNIILPEAFEMLEEGKSISETKIAFSDRIDAKLEKTFLFRLNYYIKRKFRQKFYILKNITTFLFTILVCVQLYEQMLNLFSYPENYTTFQIIFNVVLLLIFINLVYQLFNWEGRYIRSVIYISAIFTISNLLAMLNNEGDLKLYLMLILSFITGGLALFLYKRIFPSHGIMGPTKEIIKENDILDDFR